MVEWRLHMRLYTKTFNSTVVHRSMSTQLVGVMIGCYRPLVFHKPNWCLPSRATRESSENRMSNTSCASFVSLTEARIAEGNFFSQRQAVTR